MYQILAKSKKNFNRSPHEEMVESFFHEVFHAVSG